MNFYEDFQDCMCTNWRKFALNDLLLSRQNVKETSWLYFLLYEQAAKIIFTVYNQHFKKVFQDIKTQTMSNYERFICDQ